MKALNFFDILTNINEGARAPDLFEGLHAAETEEIQHDVEKAYNNFMINRGLSFFQDSVLFANELNQYGNLPPKMSYDFFKNSLRPRKRFSKWFKAQPDSPDIELIKKRYGYSSSKAREALNLFSESDLATLRKLMDHGGKS